MKIKIQKALSVVIYGAALSFMFAFVAFVYFHMEWNVPRVLYVPVYIGSFGIILSLISAYAIKTMTTRKLAQITNVAEKVSKGDFSQRIELDASVEELDRMVTVFNNVVEYAENMTKDLERKVAERTRDLENKIEQLKRWENATIGRELKMIELKKEIRRLKMGIRNGDGVDILNTSIQDKTDATGDDAVNQLATKTATNNNENVLDVLIRQHKEIMNTANNIINLTKNITGNSANILSALRKMSAQIVEHIQIEDTLFYPQLLESMKKRGVDTTKIKIFIKDMDDILSGADDFFKKYNSEKSITHNTTRFKDDLNAIVGVIATRIESEEDGVYLYWDFGNK